MIRNKLRRPSGKLPSPPSPQKKRPEDSRNEVFPDTTPLNKDGAFESLGEGCYRRLPTMRD